MDEDKSGMVVCTGCEARGYPNEWILESEAHEVDGDTLCEGCYDDYIDSVNSQYLDDIQSGYSSAESYDPVYDDRF